MVTNIYTLGIVIADYRSTNTDYTDKSYKLLTMIILTNQNYRQIPERGHIERLEQLALICRTVAVKSKGHGPLLRVLLSESQATSQRYLSSHYSMAAIKSSVLLIEMHRAPFSFGAPSSAAHELGECLQKSSPTADEGAVIPISGDNSVLLGDCSLHSNSHGFLTIVEMAKSSNQFGFIKRVGSDLHASHKRHFAKESKQLLGAGVDGTRGWLAFVSGERDRSLDCELGRVIGGR